MTFKNKPIVATQRNFSLIQVKTFNRTPVGAMRRQEPISSQSPNIDLWESELQDIVIFNKSVMLFSILS